MKPFLYGCLVVLVAVMPAYAGGHSLNVVGGHCYSAPVKGYGYQQHYVKPYVYYVPGYQVGSALREEAIAERAAQKAIADYVDKLQANITADLKGKISVEFGASASGTSSGSTTSGPVSDDTGLGRVQQIVSANNCQSCHSPSGTMSSFDLTDVSQLTGPQLRKMAQLVRLGKMPPKGKGEVVSNEDSEWLDHYTAELD
jgi:mono/diheme cytochrome c family protein